MYACLILAKSDNKIDISVLVKGLIDLWIFRKADNDPELCLSITFINFLNELICIIKCLKMCKMSSKSSLEYLHLSSIGPVIEPHVENISTIYAQADLVELCSIKLSKVGVVLKIPAVLGVNARPCGVKQRGNIFVLHV
jgi:hypothetical protein